MTILSSLQVKIRSIVWIGMVWIVVFAFFMACGENLPPSPTALQIGTPTQVAARLAAAEPQPTASSNPTVKPVSTATLTPTPILHSAITGTTAHRSTEATTVAPMPESTATVILPTATPTAITKAATTTAISTATPTSTPTSSPTPTDIPEETPTITPAPSPTAASILTATPASTPTPSARATAIPTATPTNTPSPTVKLTLDAEATLAGYWSDGTANVEVTISLRNEGYLRVEGAQSISVSCRKDGEIQGDCGLVTSVSLSNGFGPTAKTLTLRVPMGEVSFEFLYGGAESETLNFDVPARIVGVDRDVWQCFRDTSKVNTVWEKDEGIGCAAWPREFIQKWDHGSPIKVWTEGPESFVEAFRDVIDDLSPVLGLKFEWIDAKHYADIVAYVGLTIHEVYALGIGCDQEAGGCALTRKNINRISSARIIVYHLYPEQGTTYEELEDWYKQHIVHVMIHEAVHALTDMQHRTELLSAMDAETFRLPALSRMDDALLRIHGNPLVKHGMRISEIEPLIVFDDELIDPLHNSTLAQWKLLSNAYLTLRAATSAQFTVQTAYPGCSSESDLVAYKVGNLTGGRPYFGWTKIESNKSQGYLLRAHPGEVEYWMNTPSGWKAENTETFFKDWSSLREDLIDPHHMLESVLRYADLKTADISFEPDGKATLIFEIDPSTIPLLSFAEQLQVTMLIDQETYELTKYNMEWKLKEGLCKTYSVEAESNLYDVEFQFPEAVRQGSDFVENCIEESLGVLTGTVRRSGTWARECGRDLGKDGYARPYRFSLNDWAFVRLEVLSADDIGLNLLSDDGSEAQPVTPEAAGYLIAERGIELLDTDRLRWVHGALPPGEYTAEVLTHNRASPGEFTFTVNAQLLPPPPHHFTTVSVGGQQSCGLLSDGTPICWGRRIWYRGMEAWSPPGEKFVSISSGTHSCGLREDGTAACWAFKYQGEHTCKLQEDGGRFCRLDDQGPSWEPPPNRLQGDFSAVTYIRGIAGYVDQTPPTEERFASISVGGGFTCALRENGSPVCWGANNVPASTPSDERLTSISSGAIHACGLRLDGTAVCWGRDTYKQSSVPTDERFISISAGEIHTCALREDGTTLCWGDGGNQTCTLNPGGTYNCHGTVTNSEFIPLSPPEGEWFASISSKDGTCALRPDGIPVCWTRFQPSGLMSPPEGERFISISATDDHACGLREDGSVVCWGNDLLGQASPPFEQAGAEIP